MGKMQKIFGTIVHHKNIPGQSMWSAQLRRRRFRFLTALVAGSMLAVFITGITGFAAACSRVRQDTLRLHIVANSDSAEDQAIKLKVRDAVLQATGEAFGQANSTDEAIQTAQGQLQLAQQTAREVLQQYGKDQPVSAQLVEMYFPTTHYTREDGSSYTLPAGKYRAVRILLGKAEGHNWFCVLFPQLCLPAAMGEQTGYDAADEQVVDSGFTVRFAVVELLEQGRAVAEKALEKLQ